MARQVLPIVGAVVGAYFGNPQLGYAIGSIIGNAVDPQHIQGPRLQELPVMGTTEGAYRQVVMGTSVVRNCQLLDWGPLEDVTVEDQQGKGGGPVVESQRLYQTYAVGIGEPIAGVRYIKRNGIMVYDVRPGSSILAESVEFGRRLRFYDGSETQLPDPDLEALPHNGVGNTPAYRGTSYFVIVRDDLTDLQGRIPTYEVEAVRAGEVVPIDPVGMVVLDNQSSAGGVPVNWIQVHEYDMPLEAFSVFQAELVDTDQPARVRAYYQAGQGGALLFDSGWMGNTSHQIDLDAALLAVTLIQYIYYGDTTDVTDPTQIGLFRTGLTGSILGTTSVETPLIPQFAATSARVQIIRPWNSGAVAVGAEVTVLAPDPVDVPEPYTALAEPFGVLIGQETSTAYYTPYYEGPGTIDPDVESLANIVADVCDRCGIPADKLSLSQIASDVVRGITLGGPYNGAGTLTVLMPGFFFDLCQPEEEVVAIKRGGAVQWSITEADLIEFPDEAALRGQEIEYPRQLQLKYLDCDQNYAAPAAVVSRTTPDVRVNGEAILELPISMNRTEAVRTADRALKVMWEDLNGEVPFAVPARRFAEMTAGDVIALTLRGAVYRLRAEKCMAAEGQLDITGKRDRQSAYTSNLTPNPLPPPAPPPPSLAGVTIFAALNIPGIIDADDQLGFRIGICGMPNSAWRGANIAYSSDSGANWTSLGNVTRRTVMGLLQAPLAAASEFYTDATNAVLVQLISTGDELESLTQQQFLSEQNPAAIVYPDGTAELIQFRDVEDLGDGLWRLTTLQRGRLATAAGPHATGARFVMLDGTSFLTLPTALVGQTLQLRVTSIGSNPETAPVYSFVWDPAHSQTEFPAAFLTLERSGGDIVANWSPRWRFGTDVNPVQSLRFGGWGVEVSDGTVTNTFTTTTPDFVHSDSPYTGPVTVTVAQLNTITGAGPSISEIV